MGQEIEAVHFGTSDFHRFERHLVREMALLHEWFDAGRFSSTGGVGGLELEAWLIDDSGRPVPENETFLEHLGSESVVPEMSKYNIEFNVAPQPLCGPGLRVMAADLQESFNRAKHTAEQCGWKVLAIGILPTIDDTMLTLATMSNSKRYRALNEQVLRLRRGRPIRIDITGIDHLHSEHLDVMLEPAATSFQVHLQVPLARSVRYYNAAMIASAATVAVAANSPFLFGHSLWEETRIPLFEQAVDAGGTFERVTFGNDYVHSSLEELFLENRACHPVLLPTELDASADRLPHVRLHNGTIWRWNRALIGFDPDGQPHLRIEHRPMAAGPTLIDSMADLAFSVGLIESLANREPSPESILPFANARSNFYAAARHGFDAHIRWLDGWDHSLGKLIEAELVPAARAGLASFGIDVTDIDSYLDVIRARTANGQNGARWQRGYVARNGPDMAALVRRYHTLQNSGRPVHEWPL